MQDFQQRKKVRRKLYSRNAVIALGLIALFLLRGAYEVMRKERESAAALAEAQTQLDAAEADQAALSANVALLDTDAGVEQQIREKYSVVKPGESVALIVDSDATATATSAVRQSVWAKIGNWFKDVF